MLCKYSWIPLIEASALAMGIGALELACAPVFQPVRLFGHLLELLGRDRVKEERRQIAIELVR